MTEGFCNEPNCKIINDLNIDQNGKKKFTKKGDNPLNFIRVEVSVSSAVFSLDI